MLSLVQVRKKIGIHLYLAIVSKSGKSEANIKLPVQEKRPVNQAKLTLFYNFALGLMFVLHN